jgi:NTE family protein
MKITLERNSAERPEASGGAGHEPTFSNQVRTINLALQGGGAHGAFTWGVLDRLLKEKDLAFEGLSATSAGAMNAAVFAYGLAVDGREGARKALTGYWKRVSDAARLGPLQPSPIDRMLGDHKLSWSPVFCLMGFVTRVLSPYEFNPADYSPLRDMVEQSIDFDVLKCPDCPVMVFLSATNVRTGKVKIFAGKEISASAVMASACVPTMFRAVEIDGEAGTLPADLQLQEHRHCHRSYQSAVPQRGAARRRRYLEPHQRDQLQFVSDAGDAGGQLITKLVTQNRIVNEELKRVLIHGIADDESMGALSSTSKYNADRDFLIFLRDQGRKCAGDWLAKNFVKLGVESSVDR